MTNNLEISKRLLPPKQYQFLPGTSGFPQGKRKGTVSLKRLTRKVAMKTHRVMIDGKWQRRTLLDLVLLKVKQMSMAGHPTAATLLAWVRELIRPGASEEGGGFLIVPERAKNDEESVELLRLYAGAHRVEPGSEEWYRRQNLPKTPPEPKPVLDPSSPLAMALKEFEQKWGRIPYEFDDEFTIG